MKSTSGYFQLFLLGVIMLSLIMVSHCQSQEEIDISDYDEQQEQYHSQQYPTGQDEGEIPSNDENAQRQMQYFSQRRTACLVLSRYYTNQFSEQINGIVKGMQPQDQTKFINKLYSTAVLKCQPIISESQVVQFFTATNEDFDPSGMFHIFDGYNFYEIQMHIDKLTPEQQAVVKFIKQFDDEMAVRKEEQQAQKSAEERDDGLEVFFISVKNLPAHAKYLYIVLVILVCGVSLYFAFGQLGHKKEKAKNKRRKKQ